MKCCVVPTRADVWSVSRPRIRSVQEMKSGRTALSLYWRFFLGGSLHLLSLWCWLASGWFALALSSTSSTSSSSRCVTLALPAFLQVRLPSTLRATGRPGVSGLRPNTPSPSHFLSMLCFLLGAAQALSLVLFAASEGSRQMHAASYSS